MDEQKNLVLKLSTPDQTERRNVLEELLKEAGTPYETQIRPAENEFLRDTVNFIITPPNTTPRYLFCAHYDSHPESPGGNDNAAAVILLLQAAQQIVSQRLPVQIVFFDGEERDFAGSRLFCEENDLMHYVLAINFDMCGYGDTLVAHRRGRLAKGSIDKRLLKKAGVQLLDHLPEGDDQILAQYHVSTLSVAIVPKWDVHFFKVLNQLRRGIFGSTPEYYQVQSQMEIFQTLHGGSLDLPEYVQSTAMGKIADLISKFLTEIKEEN